jgi:hypothetical protein
MRNIIIIGMLLTAASTAGWFTIHRDGDNVSIDIDRAEIRSDTSKMIERSREALNRQEQLAAQLRNQQQSGQPMNGQPQQASPWGQQQPAPWGSGQPTANYPLERGFAGPPPAYNTSGYPPPQTYSPNQNNGGQNYAPTQYYPPPYSAPNQNYAPYQHAPNQNAPYNVPPANYPRQASPNNLQPTYPR